MIPAIEGDPNENLSQRAHRWSIVRNGRVRGSSRDFAQSYRKREYHRDSAFALSAFEQEAWRRAAKRSNAQSKRRVSAASLPALPEATTGRAIEQPHRHRSHETVGGN